MTGEFYHSSSTRSATVIKFDTNGNLLWGREIGGSTNNEARRVVQTSDGGYVITGRLTTIGQGG